MPQYLFFVAFSAGQLLHCVSPTRAGMHGAGAPSTTQRTPRKCSCLRRRSRACRHFSRAMRACSNWHLSCHAPCLHRCARHLLRCCSRRQGSSRRIQRSNRSNHCWRHYRRRHRHRCRHRRRCSYSNRRRHQWRRRRRRHSRCRHSRHHHRCRGHCRRQSSHSSLWHGLRNQHQFQISLLHHRRFRRCGNHWRHCSRRRRHSLIRSCRYRHRRRCCGPCRKSRWNRLQRHHVTRQGQL